jgi:hypothetical protein
VHRKLPEARILPDLPARDPEGGTGAYEALIARARERAPGHTAPAREDHANYADTHPARRLTIEATINL